MQYYNYRKIYLIDNIIILLYSHKMGYKTQPDT